MGKTRDKEIIMKITETELVELISLQAKKIIDITYAQEIDPFDLEAHCNRMKELISFLKDHACVLLI